jgi:hypothetical protein
MSIFDLLFLLVALLTLVALAAAVGLAIRRRFRRALGVLGGLAVCLCIYLGVGLAVSAAQPQRVIAVGEAWCFDDWCLTVNSVHRTPASEHVVYMVGLDISSRARGITQRANGAWIYLIDNHGKRYAAQADSSEVPLDVQLGPGERVSATRTFLVPAEVQNLGLVTGHGGSYCSGMNFLVIGQAGCVFGKPAMVRIQ